MEFDYAILADGATPRVDGKLDLFGATWDTIFAGDVPAVHAHLALAVRVFVSPTEAAADHRLDVALEDAEGVSAAVAGGQVESYPPDRLASRREDRPIGVSLVLNLEKLVLPAYGAYRLVLSWDQTVFHAVPIYLEPVPESS